MLELQRQVELERQAFAQISAKLIASSSRFDLQVVFICLSLPSIHLVMVIVMSLFLFDHTCWLCSSGLPVFAPVFMPLFVCSSIDAFAL